MRTKIKNIAPVILSLALVLTFAACKRNEPTQPAVSAADLDYEAFWVGSSLSAAGVEYTAEMDIHTKEEKADPSVPKTVTLTINGKTITGAYSHSEKKFPNVFYEHVYYGRSVGHEFTLDDSGQLLRFIWGDMTAEFKAANKKELTEEACLAIAKDFILNTVSDKINLDAYTINKSDGLTQGYRFVFKKYINGFATMDEARVGVLKSGEVYSYSSTMFGRISADDMPGLDQEKITQAVEKKLDSICQDVRGNYAAVKYEEPELYFTFIEDNKPAFFCMVTVHFETGDGGSIGELVEMIIT